MPTISGEFDIVQRPLEGYVEGVGQVQFARLSIDKVFRGPLNATSRGEMLSAQGSGGAGYVAIEQVDGTLDGKQGTFVLQHFGTMHDGDYRLILEVVPGTGTEGLTGLSGTMSINLRDGQHFYDFAYTFST
ncbi:MAG: DUF3224 domain-containing protein [Anaerolineales bacterium]|nr:DUF3224 domain-containing protein [Anaerolineales bacterium]MCB9126713.1 DUF3224 domain-containing protein [Ardenticatenales bacterium]MCB9171745.1 DUF3224 domain-containing protein [Ardenticatenales bacterium]